MTVAAAPQQQTVGFAAPQQQMFGTMGPCGGVGQMGGFASPCSQAAMPSVAAGQGGAPPPWRRGPEPAVPQAVGKAAVLGGVSKAGGFPASSPAPPWSNPAAPGGAVGGAPGAGVAVSKAGLVASKAGLAA